MGNCRELSGVQSFLRLFERDGRRRREQPDERRGGVCGERGGKRKEE
jgi:hypothetical protein